MKQVHIYNFQIKIKINKYFLKNRFSKLKIGLKLYNKVPLWLTKHRSCDKLVKPYIGQLHISRAICFRHYLHFETHIKFLGNSH